MRKDALNFSWLNQFRSNCKPFPIELPSNLTTRLLLNLRKGLLIPLADLALQFQVSLWRKHPGLVLRLSDFLPIGGTCTLIQASLLYGSLQAGIPLIWATILALQSGVLVNFIGNRFITWRARFPATLSKRNNLALIPQFIIFDLSTPSVWLKLVGISGLSYYLSIPILLSWLFFEIVGVMLNYLGADMLSFGLIARFLAASPQIDQAST